MPASTRASSPPTSASPSSSRRWCETIAMSSLRWQGRHRLISPPAIHDIVQCAAGLEALDLAGDISGNRVRIRVGRVMRREHDPGMGPERALRWQRLLGKDVERGGAERAVVEAGNDVSLVLQTAAGGIDHDRR